MTDSGKIFVWQVMSQNSSQSIQKLHILSINQVRIHQNLFKFGYKFDTSDILVKSQFLGLGQFFLCFTGTKSDTFRVITLIFHMLQKPRRRSTYYYTCNIIRLQSSYKCLKSHLQKLLQPNLVHIFVSALILVQHNH